MYGEATEVADGDQHVFGCRLRRDKLHDLVDVIGVKYRERIHTVSVVIESNCDGLIGEGSQLDTVNHTERLNVSSAGRKVRF